MNNLLHALLICGLVLISVKPSRAAIEVNLYSSAAPNVYTVGSASYNTWWNNAVTAIRAGELSLGSGNGAYSQLAGTGGISTPQLGYQALVTGFDSWHGVVGGTGENGTRIQFIYHIKATAGEPLALANFTALEVYQTGWGETNTGMLEAWYGHVPSFNSSTTFLSQFRLGFTSNGSVVSSGNNMTGIVEIIGTYGWAAAVYSGDTNGWYQAGDTDQDTLNRAISDVQLNLQSWRASVTYAGATVESTVVFIPEPSTFTLVLFAAAGLLCRAVKRT